MRVIGVDLAWADAERSRGRTGLCAIDDDHVLDSACVRSDGEIEAFVARWRGPATLVAFDAPLVVPPGGRRRGCEDVLSSAFRGEHAGPYPTSLERLGGRVRARSLAERLGLGVDPAAAATSRAAAIEVYPHPALVCLFDLPERLPYKGKRGRSLGVRRRALATLVDCLLALKSFDPVLDVTSAPTWRRLCEQVAVAGSAASLDRVEDELDAYVCAYVGRYHCAWAGQRSLTVGDHVAGYIVTPVDDRHDRLIRQRAAACQVRVG